MIEPEEIRYPLSVFNELISRDLLKFVLVEPGIKQLESFFQGYPDQYENGIIDQMLKWSFCSEDLYEQMKNQVTKKFDYMINTYTLNRLSVIKRFCKINIGSLANIISDYERLLDQAPGVLNGILKRISLTMDSRGYYNGYSYGNDMIFLDYCCLLLLEVKDALNDIMELM